MKNSWDWDSLYPLKDSGKKKKQELFFKERQQTLANLQKHLKPNQEALLYVKGRKPLPKDVYYALGSRAKYRWDLGKCWLNGAFTRNQIYTGPPSHMSKECNNSRLVASEAHLPSTDPPQGLSSS